MTPVRRKRLRLTTVAQCQTTYPFAHLRCAGKVQRLEKEKKAQIEEITDLSAQVG